MIVNRWQAPLLPNKEQLKLLLTSEGIEPFEESLAPNGKIGEHKHPFCEVRVICSGTLLINVSGNQVLLRPGDRIEIPANTRHTKSAQGGDEVLSVVGYRAI